MNWEGSGKGISRDGYDKMALKTRRTLPTDTLSLEAFTDEGIFLSMSKLELSIPHWMMAATRYFACDPRSHQTSLASFADLW